MGRKQPIDLIDDELLTIINRIFMDGGSAYREKGFFSRWRGWVDHNDWQGTMVKRAGELEEYFKKHPAKKPT